MFLPQNIFTQVNHVGLSITPYAVRAVVVEAPDKIIAKAEVVADALLLDGENVNIPKLTEVLKQIKQQLGVDEVYAACCFPEKFAYTREHTLPPITNTEIDEAVNWQLGTIFPFNPQDLYADWKLISQTGTETRIVISAVNRKLIDSLVASCNAAGIKPLSFESSASALARSFKEIPPSALIIEIDNFGSTITLVEQGISSITATTNFSRAANSEALLTDISASVSQLKTKTGDQQVSVYATGEKAVDEIIAAISSQINQPVNRLGADQVPSSFQSAYIEGISTIEPPESNKTINLLPKKIEQVYQAETDINQAKTVAKYGIAISSIAFLFALGLLVTTLLLSQASARQLESIPEPPSPLQEINLNLLLQKAQKITQLQSAEYVPTQQLDVLLAILDPQAIKQIAYDASKKTIILTLSPPHRDELFSLKTALDDTKLFGPISIPLSALNSDKSENIVLSLSIL